MKKILILALVAISLYANSLKVGDTIPSTNYKDQFEKSHTINNSTKTLIIAFTRDGGNIVKDTLEPKGNKFLEEKGAMYLADISGMPSLISSFFAIPKMKKYSFNILLEQDKSLQDVYPYSEDKITILKLENNKIKEIKYVSTKEEILNSL
jgi:hypothetical protein